MNQVGTHGKRAPANRARCNRGTTASKPPGESNVVRNPARSHGPEEQ